IERLILQNHRWANGVLIYDPNFFKESGAKSQAPHTLWIGCADSRVPPSVITASPPGDIFVNRNIANQLHPDDDGVLAVLQYAIDSLGVEHVVIVGHSLCGGAAACLAAVRDGNVPLPPTNPLNRWLAPLALRVATLGISSAEEAEALALVVDENVKWQLENLSKTSTIVNAWADPKKNVYIHGLVYDLASRRLRDLGISR
ncbi:carbonic anhydrase, partial [Pluteus cervinus]